MKKYFLFACVAAALVSCSSDEFLGENPELTQKTENDGAILFKAYNGKAQRADKVGAAAADLLGGKFFVEGVKASEASTKFNDAQMVFDNYLVEWTANSAGKAEDNTDDWAYVGKTSILRSGATAAQTIKYWDYKANNYQFIAFSTGKLNAVTGDPTANTSVKVSGINKENVFTETGAFTLTAKGANDLLNCYYTDITKVETSSYKNTVSLKFKNLAAKVRVGLYEVIPGYKVTDVKFYSAVPTTYGTGSTSTAALFTSASNIPTSGAVTVYYDAEGKATAKVTTATADTKTSKVEFGTFTTPSGGIGTSLPNATFSAGSPANDAYFTAVMPADVEQSLTLMCDYTLTSEDGSGETINVYGAKAVVPAKYTNWLPNYAYTYIFKISDNTNGRTNPTDTNPDHDGLFPITFDAVVADITDASTAEQTTVTTVATPSITSYQKDHKKGEDYKAGDIYMQVMNDGTLISDLNGSNKSYLYTLAAGKTEADVIDALQMGTTSGSVTTGRNGLALTNVTSSLTTDVTKIPGADGKDITVTAGTAAEFTATAGKDYAFVYDFTGSATPATKDIYSYDDTVSLKAGAPTDWATICTKFYTTTDGETFTQVASDAEYNSTYHYYQKFTNNGRSYAVKVIHVPAATPSNRR